MKPVFCRSCGAPLVESVPPGEDRARHHCPACGHVEYLNPRVRAACLGLLPGGGAALRTALLRPGERLQAGVVRALGVQVREDDLVLYCAITDRRAAEVCLVFRSLAPVVPATPEDAPCWQSSLLSRFERDADQGTLAVYTAETDGTGLAFARVDPAR